MLTALKFIETIFIFTGVWVPEGFEGYKKQIYTFYSIFYYNLLIGTYVIIQFVYLCQVLGNIALMTSAAFLLITNMSMSLKIFNIIWRRDQIRDMIKKFKFELLYENRKAALQIMDSFEKEHNIQLVVYLVMTFICVMGWLTSVEKYQLPLVAWYPYETTKSPAYELTYAHQFVGLFLSALINVCCDTLVTALIAQCRCRLKWLALSFRTLCEDFHPTEKGVMRSKDEEVIKSRITRNVIQHEVCLEQARLIETFFTVPILVQFTVSMVIICVSAYQLLFESGNMIWIIGMLFYLADMAYQVFIYCYHGDELFRESIGISDAVYEAQWYTLSVKLRRSLLIVMTRTRRPARLTAGGFADISLPCFMSIIKASYSFFTVLQRVEE